MGTEGASTLHMWLAVLGTLTVCSLTGLLVMALWSIVREIKYRQANDQLRHLAEEQVQAMRETIQTLSQIGKAIESGEVNNRSGRDHILQAMDRLEQRLVTWIQALREGHSIQFGDRFSTRDVAGDAGRIHKDGR